MFRRKKGDNDDDNGLPDRADDLGIPLKPGPRPPGAMTPPRPITPATPAAPQAGARPADEIPRRPSEPLAAAAPSLAAETPAKPRESETRRLIVGREISLSGEITSCERLVVEGSVEANLANCREVEIAEGGLFKGAAAIEEAEIRGRFQGTLTVRGRLLIRETGKVTGTVRYGQIEVECGGEIAGDIQAQASSDDRSPRSILAGMAGEAKI